VARAAAAVGRGVNRDLTFGLVALAFAATYYSLTTAIPESALADAVGPKGLPKIYALLLAALAMIVIVGSRPRRRAPTDGGRRAQPTTDPDTTTPWRMAGMLGIGVVYLLVVPWLGYVPTLAALILASALFQGSALTARLVLISGGGAVVLWALFVLLLRIPQPAGVWESVF
jgi:putative tricarboxylic transport membrane protein